MKPSKDIENRSQKNFEHEEIELILRLKKGDRQVFEAIYYLYKNQLLFFLIHKIISIEDAEDIVQDVFIKIWNERENINEQKSFNGYVFTIAKNCMIDYYRKYSREKAPLLDAYITKITKENPEDIFVDKEKQLNLQEAINKLLPQQKKIHQLHYEQKKPLNDIAKEMNISLSAVQNAINKMIKKVYKYFEKKGYF
jgi:RNA polymerase sigma-70 factor (ECF subfamily)